MLCNFKMAQYPNLTYFSYKRAYFPVLRLFFAGVGKNNPMKSLLNYFLKRLHNCFEIKAKKNPIIALHFYTLLQKPL